MDCYHNESGIFNVNVYIDMKAEFKFLFTSLDYSWKRVCTHGVCVEVSRFSFVKFVFLRRTWHTPLSGQVL